MLNTPRVLRARTLAMWVTTALSTTVVACATTGNSATGSGSGSYNRRDERQYIGSFSDVLAVAVSRRYVFSATPSGVGIYDRVFNTWSAPLTRENGLTDARISFMAGDPVEDAVWIGVPGAVVMYRPQVEQVQRTIIPGIPDYIAFDKSGTGDAYVRAGRQWTRVSRAGIAFGVSNPPAASTLVLPKTLTDLYAQFPVLRSSQSLLFRNQLGDRALRSYAISSGASSPERASEVWLGTNGDGLYKVDPTFQQATPLRFGPIESGIGALALASDGVWSAGLGESRIRGGLSFARNDLQRWRWVDGTISVPLAGVRTQAMSLRAQRAWLATDRGLVRVRLDAGEDVATWTTLDGMPDDRVYAVSARGEGAWAGTARGLVWVNDSGPARDRKTRGLGMRVMEGAAIYALQQIGDTLWMGTSDGLVAMPGNGAVLRPSGIDPALRRPIRALAWSDTVLLAATDDAVLQLAPKGGAEPSRVMALDVRQVGTVTRLAIDDRTIWLAGSNGVLILARNSGATRLLRIPADLPGPALDVVASRDWLWIGTPFGLVRLRRVGDGGLP